MEADEAKVNVKSLEWNSLDGREDPRKKGAKKLIRTRTSIVCDEDVITKSYNMMGGGMKNGEGEKARR